MRAGILAAAMAGLCACAQVPPELSQADLARLAAPGPRIEAEVARLTPAIAAEDRAREARALAEGRALSPHEQEIARAVGAQAPEKVRLLFVAKMPEIADPALRRLMPVGRAWGLTTGYGVTLTQDPPPDWLLAHEFAHVAQFERLGHRAMERRMLVETLVLPRNLIPVEREAIAAGSLVAPSPAYGY